MTYRKVFFLLAAVIMAAYISGSSNAAAADSIPQKAAVIEELKGRAKAESPDRKKRKLAKGAELFVGDKITTGRGTKIQIKFNDDMKINLGAKATMTIDEFFFEKGNKKSKCKSSLTRGMFKLTGGQISKIAPDQAGIKTPVAYIGIRGTECVGTADATKAVAIYTEGNAISVTNEHGQTILTGESGMGCETKLGEAPGKARKYSLAEINALTMNVSMGMMRNIGNIGTGAGARAGALGGMHR
ncbi:MAG: FecR family protein [Planctomycetota bacterium]|jgi:hypothetical protein